MTQPHVKITFVFTVFVYFMLNSKRVVKLGGCDLGGVCNYIKLSLKRYMYILKSQ